MLTTEENILILGEGSTDGLDHATNNSEAKYSINNTKSRKEVTMKLKIYRSKVKVLEIKPY